MLGYDTCLVQETATCCACKRLSAGVMQRPKLQDTQVPAGDSTGNTLEPVHASSPRQEDKVVQSPTRTSRHSGKSGTSHKSQHRAAAVGGSLHSPLRSNSLSARKAGQHSSTAEADSKPARSGTLDVLAAGPAQAADVTASTHLAADSMSHAHLCSESAAAAPDIPLQHDADASAQAKQPPAAEAKQEQEDDSKAEPGAEAQTQSAATKSACAQADQGDTDVSMETAESGQQEPSAAEQFAQQVRSKAGWGPAVDVNVRSLMASATMAGQPVHIQLKNREPVYLQGTQGSFWPCPRPLGKNMTLADAIKVGQERTHTWMTCHRLHKLLQSIERLD